VRIGLAIADGFFSKYGNSDGSNVIGLVAEAYLVRKLRSMGYKEFDKYPDEDRVRIIKRVGDEGWTRMMGYGRRWAVETALSTFERQYGEYCIAKMESIEKELKAKAYIYNMLINL